MKKSRNRMQIANDLLRNSAMGIGKTHLPCCPLREFFYVLFLLFVIFLFVSFTPYFSNFLHPYFSDILIPSTSFSPFLLTGDSCHLLTIPSLLNWKQLGISEKLKKHLFLTPKICTSKRTKICRIVISQQLYLAREYSLIQPMFEKRTYRNISENEMSNLSNNFRLTR